MKTGVYLAIMALGLGACSGGESPAETATEYKVDPAYDHPFFQKNSWSYAWHMVEDDSGRLSSALADSLGEPIMDTTHYVHTAWCVKNNSEEEVVHYADAMLVNDSLQLQVHEFTASSNDQLVISICKGKRQAAYSTTFFFPYKKTDVSWKTIRQELVLNRGDFHPGDTLKGSIDFACVQHWKISREPGRPIPDDTILIKGPFKTVIKAGKP